MLNHISNKKNDICNLCMAAMLFLVPLLAMLLTFFLAAN